jgi:hypothetical protein
LVKLTVRKRQKKLPKPTIAPGVFFSICSLQSAVSNRQSSVGMMALAYGGLEVED